jgi:hypothetical protein
MGLELMGDALPIGGLMGGDSSGGPLSLPMALPGTDGSGGSGGGGLLGMLGLGGSEGNLPDPLGLGKWVDKGLDFANEAGLDKIAGGVAGTMFLGPGIGTQAGIAAGDQAGNIASGINLFS